MWRSEWVSGPKVIFPKLFGGWIMMGTLQYAYGQKIEKVENEGNVNLVKSLFVVFDY